MDSICLIICMYLTMFIYKNELWKIYTVKYAKARYFQFWLYWYLGLDFLMFWACYVVHYRIAEASLTSTCCVPMLKFSPDIDKGTPRNKNSVVENHCHSNPWGMLEKGAITWTNLKIHICRHRSILRFLQPCSFSWRKEAINTIKISGWNTM